MRRRSLTALAIAAALALAACESDGESQSTSTAPTTPASADTTAPAAAADESVLYLNLVWHQHQPWYPLDENGDVTRPWVRVHATKDYYDMAALVAEYPDVHVTFNLTPGLLLQLEALTQGTKDVYWALSEIPATDLTDEQRRFVLQRFFDTSSRIVDRFPRYRRLADTRTAAGGEDAPIDVFDDDDYRDLQVLFNLAWTDPSFLAEAPLDALVARGEGFTEDDKTVLFEVHRRIIERVIPLHAELWDAGQIEVTTTPLAHPILPLIADTDQALVGDPGAVMPEQRFRHVDDAEMQVVEGLDVAERLLGRRPTGMWPGEGSVSELVMWLFSEAGVEWVASGEEVLANSIGIGSFTRDGDDTVQEADLLYRPREADITNREPVAMFFRDAILSDRVGFEYSGTPADEAADDFMARLEAIRTRLVEEGTSGSPHVVSVILDGENAWEHYDNDGIDFLRALYQRLEDSTTIRTITPGEFLATDPELEAIENVFPGAWFQPNFATWIGEPEEATAWDYLATVREDLRVATLSGDHDDDQLAAAMDAMLFAEGSDWFWWFGSDQDSGQDSYFDAAYRQLLGEVYDALGVDRPAFVDVPIIPRPIVAADASQSELVTPTIDGTIDDAEWTGGGVYELADLGSLRFGFDTEKLFVGLDFLDGAGPFELYLAAPELDNDRGTTLAGTVLGFAAGARVTWSGGDTVCIDDDLPTVGNEDRLGACTEYPAGAGGSAVEFSIPIDLIGPLASGDRVLFAIVDGDRHLSPAGGPAVAIVPDISNVAAFIEVTDPTGDDDGPGTYAYPTDPVFAPGSFDIVGFQAGTEGDELVLSFDMGAPITNPWGSPNGLALQTFDIYVDTDPGAGTGTRILLPGRRAALEDGFGWEYGITVEGWDSAVYVIEADGTATETKPSFDVAVLGEKGKVIIRLPMSIFGGADPAGWAMSAMVLSQEGYPSPGVRRVRDVHTDAEQWYLGGAPSDTNHTRVIDVAWPDAGTQHDLLSDYPASQGSSDDLGPDDLPQVPALMP